ANPSEGKISNESPLGKALINKKTGDKVQVEAPQGTFVVSILKVE
ncbi:transcription elongation factor GreA, partial [bacterium]|nr:transcription elongation factor GreA [bacterium]